VNGRLSDWGIVKTELEDANLTIVAEIQFPAKFDFHRRISIFVFFLCSQREVRERHRRRRRRRRYRHNIIPTAAVATEAGDISR
jgi:hypothetical protein